MTTKFPVDAPRAKVIGALRQGNHIAMVRDNADGTRTPLTLPGCGPATQVAQPPGGGSTGPVLSRSSYSAIVEGFQVLPEAV